MISYKINSMSIQTITSISMENMTAKLLDKLVHLCHQIHRKQLCPQYLNEIPNVFSPRKQLYVLLVQVDNHKRLLKYKEKQCSSVYSVASNSNNFCNNFLRDLVFHLQDLRYVLHLKQKNIHVIILALP